MSRVVICDTNAVIQLAIICPACFAGKEISFVVHSIVKQEIHVLRKDEDKEKRLKPIFEFIQKSIPTNNTQKFPNRQEEDRLHHLIQRVERGLPPELVTAGSSKNDRKFLMLAKQNNSILLTNEKTLFNLGKALLKEQTWRVGQAIEKIKEQKIVSNKDIQAGLDKLTGFGEFLSSECASKVRALGFKC